MSAWTFWKGVLMGLAIAAPVGPIALLCIRRTLSQGRFIGLLSGLGAASADGLYGMVAAFGLTAISHLLLAHAQLLQIAGGLFLCYLGVKSAGFVPPAPSAIGGAKPGPQKLNPKKSDPASPGAQQLGNGPLLKTTDRSRYAPAIAYGSTLALTLTNPATIFSFLGIFAGLGITETGLLNSVTLVFGVFTGSALWWLVLVSGITYLRNRFTARRLTQLNRWSSRGFGLVIFGFGITALVHPIP